jgi:hypothetical protein
MFLDKLTFMNVFDKKSKLHFMSSAFFVDLQSFKTNMLKNDIHHFFIYFSMMKQTVGHVSTTFKCKKIGSKFSKVPFDIISKSVLDTNISFWEQKLYLFDITSSKGSGWPKSSCFEKFSSRVHDKSGTGHFFKYIVDFF